MRNNLWFLMFSSLFILLVGCNNDLESDAEGKKDLTKTSVKGLMTEDGRYIYLPGCKKQSDTPQTRAGVVSRYEWAWPVEEGSLMLEGQTTIRIQFENGSNELIDEVQRIAHIWDDSIGLNFTYVDTNPDVIIRFSSINFNHEKPDDILEGLSWSYLGTDHKRNVRRGATMNLALYDPDNAAEYKSKEFEAVVLREFGHMIGLAYEHQLNKDFIVDDWALEDYLIDNKVMDGRRATTFALLYADYYTALVGQGKIGSERPKYDENSIMHFYLPFFNIDGYKPKHNTELSVQDIEYIKTVYPAIRIPPPLPVKDKVFLRVAAGNGTGYSDWGNGFVTQDFRFNYELGINPTPGSPGSNSSSDPTYPWTVQEYETITVGEYEWMRTNARFRYTQHWDANWYGMNYNYEGGFIPVKDWTNNALNISDPAKYVARFENIFGSWVSNEHYIRSWSKHKSIVEEHNQHFEFRRGSEDGEVLEDFDLPNITAIMQLIGQLPLKYPNNPYYNFMDYVYGLPEWDNPLMKDVDDVKLSQGVHVRNDAKGSPSGLIQAPMGIIVRHGDHNYQHYAKGYAMAWKMRNDENPTDAAYVFTVGNHHQSGSGSKVVVGAMLYHLTQVRYCRPMEKGPNEGQINYELYRDEANNKVVVGAWDEYVNLPTLPKGLERGIATRNMSIEYKVVLRSLSEIREEAKSIRSFIAGDGSKE